MDATEKCTLAAHHSDDKTFSTVGVPLLQSETLAAYRDKFGNDAKELDILRVDYYTDGRVKVWYSEANSGDKTHRVVSEQFQGCGLTGHTPWQEISDD